MIDSNQIRKDIALNYKGEPHVVVDFEFYKPGKGNSLTRAKLKNLRSGNVIPVNFKSGEKVEDIQVNYLPVSFMYEDGENFYFMDDKFEQYQIPANIIGSRKKYLKEESKVDGIFLEGALYEIRLPKKMKFKVTEAPEGAKGDTANNPLKQATIETGATVNVPLFIKPGETIIVNTENDEYVSRA